MTEPKTKLSTGRQKPDSSRMLAHIVIVWLWLSRSQRHRLLMCLSSQPLKVFLSQSVSVINSLERHTVNETFNEKLISDKFVAFHKSNTLLCQTSHQKQLID